MRTSHPTVNQRCQLILDWPETETHDPLRFYELFCRVGNQLAAAGKNQKHGRANWYPSEVVALALLFSLKGVGHRFFYRWIVKGYKP